jgi:quercetin dioxygenase-like cupin family protein
MLDFPTFVTRDEPSKDAGKVPSRGQIMELQAEMMKIQNPMPEPEHFFAPGMYGRKLTIPAGMLMVGKTHKHAHLMMVLSGRATVITEFDRKEVAPGLVSVSHPGAKRVVLAHEDTVFVTVHHNPDDGQDLVAIEAHHIDSEADAIEQALKGELL